PKVEERLTEYKVNVTGEHTYTSTKEAKYEINLRLVNGHVTGTPEFDIDRKAMWKVYYISPTEKPIVFFNEDTKGLPKVSCFNGKQFYLKQSKFRKYRRYVPSAQCMLVGYKLRQKETRTIDEIYKEYINNANKLKELTNGKINLYKTGTYKNA